MQKAVPDGTADTANGERDVCNMEIPSWVKKLSRTVPLCCFLVVLLSMAVTAMGNTVLDAKAKDGFVIASINASEPNVTAICASYDSQGKMVAVSTEKLEQGNHTYYFDVWAVSYQTVKIFLTDEKNAPLCNAVYVPEDDSVVQSQGYALIRWIESEYYDPRDNNQAQLLFSNGTLRTVDLYRDYLAGWFGSTLTNEEYHDYSYGNRKFVVHYTILSDGTYRLARMTDRYCTVAPSDFYIANREICNWSDVAGRVDSNTEFIVNDDGTYRLSKIQNMPNIRGNVETYAYIGSDGYAKYVWIINADFIIRTVITFVASASCSDEIVTGDQWDETYHSYWTVKSSCE